MDLPCDFCGQWENDHSLVASRCAKDSVGSLNWRKRHAHPRQPAKIILLSDVPIATSFRDSCLYQPGTGHAYSDAQSCSFFPDRIGETDDGPLGCAVSRDNW